MTLIAERTCPYCETRMKEVKMRPDQTIHEFVCLECGYEYEYDSAERFEDD